MFLGLGLGEKDSPWRRQITQAHLHTKLYWSRVTQKQATTAKMPDLSPGSDFWGIVLTLILMFCPVMFLHSHFSNWTHVSWLHLDFFYHRIFPFSAVTLLVGQQEGHPACIKLGDLLMVTIWLELCTFYSSSCHLSPPPSSLAPINSRMEIFWYRLTQVHLENGH